MGKTGILDLVSKLQPEQLLAPAAEINADAQGVEIDMQGYSSVAFLGNVGVSGDTLSGSVVIELALEESDVSGSGFTAVADEDIIDAVAGAAQTGTFAVIDDPAEDDTVYKVGYRGHKRYVRPIVNFIGTHTNGTPISFTGILGDAAKVPVDA